MQKQQRIDIEKILGIHSFIAQWCQGIIIQGNELAIYLHMLHFLPTNSWNSLLNIFNGTQLRQSRGQTAARLLKLTLPVNTEVFVDEEGSTA